MTSRGGLGFGFWQHPSLLTEVKHQLFNHVRLRALLVGGRKLKTPLESLADPKAD
jgi:hypothetical protein